MAATRTNNQVAPQTVSEQVILSPEEYQMVLNSRAQAQAPVQQVAPAPAPQPVPQTQAAPVQQIQQAPVQTAPQVQPVAADPKAEKKAKLLKAGKVVARTAIAATAGAAIATGVFLLTKSDDAAEDAAEGAAAFIDSLFI